MRAPASPTRRRRRVLLAVTAALAVLVIALAHDVMLPFVLAVVIAYVLTPLVQAAEKRRLHRGAAVLLVYLVVLGSATAFLRAVAPRIALEFRNLRTELPLLGSELNEKWVPAATHWMREAGIVAAETGTHAPEASLPAPSWSTSSPTGPSRSTWEVACASSTRRTAGSPSPRGTERSLRSTRIAFWPTSWDERSPTLSRIRSKSR